MRLDPKYFEYSVADEEIIEKIQESDEILQDALMFLFFILNHLGGDVLVVECDGKRKACVAYNGTKAKKLEYQINMIINRAFPNLGNPNAGLSCRYIDDGRGNMFHLQVGI